MQRKPSSDRPRLARGTDWSAAFRPDLAPAVPPEPADAGAPMPAPVQAKMERSFGADLSAVRIHQGAYVASADALAYTRGTDIHFAPGQYDPASERGQELLGHELTHVIQQSQGRAPRHQAKGAAIVDDPALEREADVAGARAARGEPAAIAGATVVPSDGPAQARLALTRQQLQNRYSQANEQRIPTAGDEQLTQAFNAAIDALNDYHAACDDSSDVDPVAVDRLATLIQRANVFRTEYRRVSADHQDALGGQGNVARVLNHTNTLIDLASQELTAATLAMHGEQDGDTDAERYGAIADMGAANPEMKNQLGILRHQKHLGFVGREWEGELAGPLVLQWAEARGDMYHVRAVMGLFPDLRVVIYGAPEPMTEDKIFNAQKRSTAADAAAVWGKACVMSKYYGAPDRVFYTHESISARASKAAAYDYHHAFHNDAHQGRNGNFFFDVGGCTTLIGLEMESSRDAGRYDQRKGDLAEAVAPAPGEAEDRASREEIEAFLDAHGFVDGPQYLIINFRESGHKEIQRKVQQAAPEQRDAVIGGYDPTAPSAEGNHPDLDTGAVGVQQLGQVATELGYTPVYMGEEPADAAPPHLIRYWGFEHEGQRVCRGGRDAEAFFIRVLHEKYGMRLLAMRSGVTDQLAFTGMPVISIDIDNFHQASVPELFAQPGYQMGDDETAHSWGRGSKLESGLARDYGRVFLEEQRPLDDFDDDGKWRGEFTDDDLANIKDSVEFYFGDEDQGIRHKTHPLHPDKLDATADKGAEDAEQLRSGLKGKADSSLNPQVVIQHARSVFASGDAAEARKFLGSHIAHAPLDAATKAAFTRQAVQIVNADANAAVRRIERAVRAARTTVERQWTLDVRRNQDLGSPELLAELAGDADAIDAALRSFGEQTMVAGGDVDAALATLQEAVNAQRQTALDRLAAIQPTAIDAAKPNTKPYVNRLFNDAKRAITDVPACDLTG